MDIPVIFDIHGDPLAELKFYKTSFYVFKLFFCPLEYKIALSLATRILVVSEKQKLHLIKHHKINQGKIFLIPNGFTPENLEKPKKPVEKNKGVVTLCFVGSLAKWAGGDMLIKSFKQVLERCHKKLLLYIVGDGHDRKKLENLVKRYSLSENVIFTGNVPYDRVKEYLYSSNVLVAPFIKEPALEVACPIKLLEYSYVGKPIVTTNVGEIPGQLKIKNAAIVTEPDVNSFAQGILKIVASEELSEVIGKNAMVFSKEYTWDKICEKLSEIYNSVKYSVAL